MKKWLLFTVIALLVFGLDVLTKSHMLATMTPGQTIPVYNDLLSWHLTFNRGALFGFDPSVYIAGLSSVHFFYIFNAFALLLILNYIRTMKLNQDPLIMFIGFATVTGGALGNLTDRIIDPTRGVVDFIMVDLGFKLGPLPFDPWPIFNIADIGISCGVVLIIIANFIPLKQEI